MTHDELRQSLLDARSMIESSSRHLVHVITDVGDITKEVPPKESLPIVREVGDHPRSGWHLVLRQKSILMKMGVMLGTSIFKMRTRNFDSLQQACSFLKEMDSTLSWDHLNQDLTNRSLS